MSSTLSLKQAVGLAVGTAGAAAATVGFAGHAFAAEGTGAAPAAPADNALQEVVVTGSRIRRVDVQTANPVFVLDAKQIQESGISTVGELLQRIPAVSGAATNPQVNNGGGFGESTIELRGLDAKRTLVLVDGRRLGIVGASDATDVNNIPINMIERVEVLKEGAGAVYGSDAIGGVVNFITRKSVDGLEVHADYGRTTHNDGAHHSFDMIFGTSTDKWNIMAGGSYQQQDAVYAGARDFSKYALYLYGGTYGAYKGGSSRTPTGRISMPSGSALRTQYGCSSVTRTAGSSGGSLADYRCFTGADHYNYQPYNLLITPVERGQFFTKVQYDINDHVSFYANLISNRTHSGSEIASLPFDASVDDVVISKNNLYNPFGIDFGGLTSGNPNALWRLKGLGDRVFKADTTATMFNTGLKGKIGDTGWEWDANVGYSRLDYTQAQGGYYIKSKFTAAVGPSFWADSSGNPVAAGTAGAIPTCGVPGAIVTNCTPLDIFNIFDPSQQAALQGVAATVVNVDAYRYKSASLETDGKIVDLPAGAMQGSIGFDYHSQEGQFDASSLAVSAPPLYLACQVSNEACSGSTRGKYDSREAYLELFVPILKDMPGAKALNVDAGVRYSKYSLFGSTTKSEFKVEYRPIGDLLVRGTFSQVFRVPTILDLFQAPQNTSVTFNDPCNGLTSAALAANPNLALACKGVIPDSGFREPNGQITGLNVSNPNLKPETGNVKTFGFVYDPHYINGLSVDVDYWEYNLDGLITTLDSNYAASQCVATGNPTFCNLMERYQSGNNQGYVLVSQQPTFNLGKLKTDGVDFGVHYTLRNTPIGSFQFGMDVTDTMSYLNTPAPGAAPEQIAGTYSKQFGNYARYRGLGSIGWTYKSIDGLVTFRYIHHLLLTNPSGSGVTATGAPYPPLYIGSMTYVDATVGYSFPTKTRLQLGIRNLADKQPPIFYQNNVTNANTDVETYDTLGRQWWVGVSQKF